MYKSLRYIVTGIAIGIITIQIFKHNLGIWQGILGILFFIALNLFLEFISKILDKRFDNKN